MTTRKLGLFIPVLSLIILMALVPSVLGSTSDSQPAAVLPAWHQVNADGFGNPRNQQIPSLVPFEGYLYAGTWLYGGVTESSQVWRTADGTDWQQVGAGLGNGAAHMAAFRDDLYLGTWDGNIWHSDDGLAWTAVITGGFEGNGDGIARLAVFSDTLYATTWSGTGTQVWRTADGVGWTQFGPDGFGDADNAGAIASAEFAGSLYMGVGNWDTGAQLWWTDGLTWTAVITDGWGRVDNAAVSSLATFDGYLYAGLWNESGVEVWRSPDGTQWEQVAGGGLGDPQTNRESALEVFDDELYLVARNSSTGLEVWRTADGLDWQQIGFGGLGDSANEWSYWDNATTVFNGNLYIATNNLATGGEVWQMGDYRVTLPLVARNYVRPEITLWHNWSSDYWQEYQDIIDEFNQTNPDMWIQALKIDDLDLALSEAVPAGRGPDIIAWANDQISTQALVGNIVALNDYGIDMTFLNSTYEPAAVRGVVWQDQIWALPQSQEGIAFVYNKALVTGEYLPGDPTDWVELLAKAQAFYQDTGKYLVCNQGLGNPDAYHAAPIYFGHGVPEYVDEQGTAYLNTPEALAAGQWMVDFSAVAPAESSHDICKFMILEGDAGAWWTGPWAIADLENAGIDYGIIPMGKPFVGLKALMLGANAVDRGHAGAAVYVMRYLGSAEVQKRLTLVNGTIPANTAALNDPDVQAIYTVAQFGASVNLGVPMANHRYGNCQWGPVGDATMAIWDGSQTPEQALNAAQAAIVDCVAAMSAR